MNRRTANKCLLLGSTYLAASGFPPVVSAARKWAFPLSEIRERMYAHFRKLQDTGGPYGAYRQGIGQRTDLYASADIAIARHIMGEDLESSLSDTQQQEWVDHINSFQLGKDGSYTDTFNHAPLHANGMVIGALGVLGGRQRFRVRLYNAFNTIEKAGPWLEQINWQKQWSGSHLFWGGMHCYSLSTHCTKAWQDFVFTWLNRNLDERTGWWRKGVSHADRHQPLGGSVHIIPIYQHHQRIFPYPERLIDSVLALQLRNGRWLDRKKDELQVMHYLELDALYALKYMMELAPGYRTDDIFGAIRRYADLVEIYWTEQQDYLLSLHPHRLLSAVGVFGLLQNLLPESFIDDRRWTDIFSDIRLYNTANVEKLI